MGIAMTIFGTFGSIPYPLIFGAIADSARLIYFSKNMKNLYDDEDDIEGDTNRARVTDGGGRSGLFQIEDFSSSKQLTMCGLADSCESLLHSDSL